MEPKLIVMCGLQCSGKSTKAEKLAKKYNAKILSSDGYRQIYPDATNDKIFHLLYTDMNRHLHSKQNVVFDATNITIKSRTQIFQNLKEECEKICWIMNTPIEKCYKRLEKRNNSEYPHKFGKEVIEKYYKSFQIPLKNEGWDKIEIENKPKYETSLAYDSMILRECEGFNQYNKHHTQELGEHLRTVYGYLDLRTDDVLLNRAGLFHDIGKLFTQTYKPNDENAHYYNHENVGTYELLTHTGIFDNEKYNKDKTLQWLAYINYHMILHNVGSEKSINKWKKIFGDELYKKLKLHCEADKQRKQ